MPDVSLAALGLRLAISMGVVIALMLLAAKVLRRAQAYAASTGSSKGSRSSGRKTVRIPIAVSNITPLGRNASVAIVRAGGRELVVGVTEQQITLLHSAAELADDDGQDARDASATDSSSSFDTSDEDLVMALVPDDIASLSDPDDDPATTGRRRTLLPSAARIAALAPTSPQDAGTGGSSAWMVALETMRARTVRR